MIRIQLSALESSEMTVTFVQLILKFLLHFGASGKLGQKETYHWLVSTAVVETIDPRGLLRGFTLFFNIFGTLDYPTFAKRQLGRAPAIPSMTLSAREMLIRSGWMSGWMDTNSSFPV